MRSNIRHTECQSHCRNITLYFRFIDLTTFQLYSNTVQRCFDDCVRDFSTKSLQPREEGCVMRCVDKFMKSQERLGTRFQEQNAAMAQGGAGAGGFSGR